MLAAVGVDNPKIRAALVGHDIVELPHVDDALSVRRDLRIRSELELEDILNHERFDGACARSTPPKIRTTVITMTHVPRMLHMRLLLLLERPASALGRPKC